MDKQPDQPQDNYEESITIKGKLGPLQTQDPIVIRPADALNRLPHARLRAFCLRALRSRQ